MGLIPRSMTVSVLLVFILTITLSLSSEAADPTCSKGYSKRNACCPQECGSCGGTGCYLRSLQFGTRCCPSGITNPANKVPSCNDADAPCILTAAATDPTCSTGIASRGACCVKACGQCGGKGCGMRSRDASSRCCVGGILNPSNNVKTCDKSLPPCILKKDATPSSVPTPTPTSTSNPTSTFSSFDGVWKTANVNGTAKLVARHEACAVMVNGLVVLIGGRGKKPVSVFNPKTRTWTRKSRFDDQRQIHHFQCVAHKNSIWIVASWNLGFPNEVNNDLVFEYNVPTDTWTTYPSLPLDRNRGGAASVIINNLIYVIAGNRGGHGEQATSLPWVDAFNVVTKKWTLNALPDMPDSGRDHVGAAVMKNGDICVAGGRDGGSAGFFRLNIAATYCYSFKSKSWSQKQDFPAARAGAMTGTTCEGYMMIAGGEGNGRAYKRVDVFDGKTWTRAPDLVEARHGSGLAFADCDVCGHIFIPSGSGRQGGSPELLTTEEYIPKGAPAECQRY